MGRWEPNARSRLEQAAMTLYLERGFEQTTVAEIAWRAGLTERTFFRHFADKREVLFGGAGALQDLLVRNVAAAPLSVSALGAVTSALEEAGILFQENRTHSRLRQDVIDANPVLQERELIKLASLSAALAEALRGRGVAAPAARLAAEAAITIFKVAFDRWVGGPDEPTLPELIRESLAQLRDMTAAG
jgi:AcrR family transcriptional regulator